MAGSFRRAAVCLIVYAVAGCGTATDDPKADRLFTNGAIYTVDENRSWAEAIAVTAGQIVFVGDMDGAQAWIGPETQVTDLDGYMLLPGFHDSHVHILTGVLTDEECSVEFLETAEEIETRLGECTSLQGFGEHRWIHGGYWSESAYPEANPHKDLLDEYFPDRPVYLLSAYGHSAWVNSRALELAGINPDTPDPPAGVIERDPLTGEATGTLRDSAMLLVFDLMPEPPPEQNLTSVRMAVDYANSFGITAVIEPGFDEAMLEPVIKLADEGALTLRAMTALSPLNWQPGAFGDEVFELLARREQYRRPDINVDSIKIYLDGVPEYGTAAMLEPYEIEKWGDGMHFYTQEQIDEYFVRFDEMGINIHVHAIGDAAIRMALDGFEAMRDANGFSDNRHQVVHLQLIDDVDIPRFAELDIGANFQSLWAYFDDDVIELTTPAIGEERVFRMYPIGRIARSGGRIVGGSDYSVSSIDPLIAIEVAITRQDPYTHSGAPLNADEAVDLETMIDAYTINGAWQMGLEDIQGSIEVGKRADLVILDRNLFDIPASEISEASVVMTIFDGRTVYERTTD